jgi:hypothetical protein
VHHPQLGAAGGAVVVGQSVAGAGTGTGVGGIAGGDGRSRARTADGVGQPGSVVKGEKCVSVV